MKTSEVGGSSLADEWFEIDKQPVANLKPVNPQVLMANEIEAGIKVTPVFLENHIRDNLLKYQSEAASFDSLNKMVKYYALAKHHTQLFQDREGAEGVARLQGEFGNVEGCSTLFEFLSAQQNASTYLGALDFMSGTKQRQPIGDLNAKLKGLAMQNVKDEKALTYVQIKQKAQILYGADISDQNNWLTEMEIYDDQPFYIIEGKKYYHFGLDIQEQLTNAYRQLGGKAKDETLKIKDELYYVEQLCVGQTVFKLKKAGHIQDFYTVIKKEVPVFPIVTVATSDLFIQLDEKIQKLPEAWRFSQMRDQAMKAKENRAITVKINETDCIGFCNSKDQYSTVILTPTTVPVQSIPIIVQNSQAFFDPIGTFMSQEQRKVVQLESTDLEYQLVAQMLKDSSSSEPLGVNGPFQAYDGEYSVNSTSQNETLKIEKVYNYQQFDYFLTELKRLIKKNPGQKVTEMINHLFYYHPSGWHKAGFPGQICHSDFGFKYRNQNQFNFTRSATKALITENMQVGQVFLALVLTGDQKNVQGNSHIVESHQTAPPKGLYDRYDSVTNQFEFATFNERMAYPGYLITL